MANRIVFVDQGDTHGPLDTSDFATDGNGVKYVLQGNTAGILSSYNTLALAIADTANLVNGQYVLIQGGDNAATGYANADKGIWRVNTNQGASASDYTKKLDDLDKASDIEVANANGFFGTAGVHTDAETALNLIGSKQVFYKRGDTSLRGITASGTTTTAFNSAIAALVIDNGAFTDAAGAGTSSVNGIVLTTTYGYQIPVRAALSRDIIDDGSNNEVYARLTKPGGSYVISFYSNVSGTETAYNMPSTSIDLGYVLASMDFMKLPAFAGVTDSEFFGDEAGAVGTLNDEQIITNSPAFSGLLNAQATQEAVNIKVDKLGSNANGEGASGIAIEDSASIYSSTDVEGALAEVRQAVNGKIRPFLNLAAAYVQAGTTPFQANDFVIIAGDTGNEAERGIYKIVSGDGTVSGDYSEVIDLTHTAAELLIADAGNYFTSNQAEGAIDELSDAIGGTSSGVRDYSSNVYVADNDDLVTAIGKLDAAVGAFVTDRLLTKTLVADGAIAATTNGPRFVGFGTAANDAKLLDASQSTLKEPIGFATGADYADNATINQGDGTVLSGRLAGFTGLTPGAAYYADPANPGSITSTVPTTVGYWIVPVGMALNATTLLVRIGEPNQIVPAEKTQQVGIHYKSTAGSAGGLGETGYAVAVGDIWVDNDTSVQNPTKSATGRYTVYVCTVAWTGAGSALLAGNITSNFAAIGKQN
jgi:hypothetical protein